MLLLLAAAALAQDPVPFDEALARLQAQSPDLAQADARVRQARAQAGLARAPLLPSLVVTGAYTRNDEEVVLDFADALPDDLPIEVTFPDPVTMQPLDAWTGAATATVPLLVPAAWAQARAGASGIEAARASQAATGAALELALVQVAAGQQVSEGVFAATERALETARAHHEALIRAAAAGTQPPLALLAAEADVLRREQDVAQARADRDAARRAAGTLLGEAEPVRVALPPDAEPGPAAVPADVLAADALAEAAARRHHAAALSYAPALAGVVTGQASSEPFLTGEDTAWRAQLVLSWTLFDGGAREARLADAAAQRAAARAAADAAHLRAAQAEADASAALEVARTRAALAARQRDVAREAEAVARRGLAAGTVGALDARDAAERAFAADVGAEQARAAVALAAASLRRARGL